MKYWGMGLIVEKNIFREGGWWWGDFKDKRYFLDFVIEVLSWVYE